MTRSALRRLPGTLTVLTLLCGCADLGPDVGGVAGEVAEHRRIWEAGRPSSYAVELERQCFCPEEARGPVRLTVEGAQVLTRVYSASGTTVPERYADLFPSVDGLFDILEDALARSAESIEVTWDPDSGAPASFFIDYNRNTADEEVGYRILDGPG